VDFVLFIVVTAILFIRPTDFVPGLEVPLYLIAIVSCSLLSWHKIVAQLGASALKERPVLVFAIGILVLSVLSNLVNGKLENSGDFVADFVKFLIFYLLMLAQLDSPRRLRVFTSWVACIIVVPVALAVAHFHGLIHVPAFLVTVDDGGNVLAEGATTIRRLGATGNFADPNDLCEIVNCAMIFSLCGLLRRGGGLARLLWLAPLALFGYALILTQSRGGFLAALAGVAVLYLSRFRGVKSLVLGGAILAMMFAFASGRQSTLSTKEGTGQGRIQIWDTGFEMIKESPLFGHGSGALQQKLGRSAHNAFVAIYTDLGVPGGTLLFGQYFYCLANLVKLGSKKVTLPDPEMRRLRPYLLASMASFATSEMSLTHPYALITYTMFGLGSAGIRLADPSPPLAEVNLSGRLVSKVLLYSVAFFLALYAFVRLSVRYG
jgi:O-antigen ligase